MTAVLHLFDSKTPPPALDILQRLRRRRPNDLTARVGPAAGQADLPAADRVLRRPWPWTLTAGGGLRDLVGQSDARLIHCWSAGLSPLAASCGPGVCVSLFRPPPPRDLAACRQAVQAGAVVVASSTALQRRLVSDGLPAEAIEVLAPAVETHPPDVADRRQARGRWALADTDRVVAARAESDADNCGYWAVWAAGILHHMAEPVSLLLIGSDNALRRAQTLSRSNGLGRSIHLVERSDQAHAWAAADVAVMYDAGGFGLTGAAAAVGAGAAVVAADAGELRDGFVHERTALLVPPRSPRLLARGVWRLFDDPRLRDRLAGNAVKELTALRDGAAVDRRLEALYARLSGG